MLLGIEAGEAIACIGGAVLAEGIRPSVNWKGSIWNVLLGIAFGSYGPLGVEAYFQGIKEAHRLVTFICAFVGSSVLRYIGEQAAERRFLDWMPTIKGFADILRKPPEGGKL